MSLTALHGGVWEAGNLALPQSLAHSPSDGAAVRPPTQPADRSARPGAQRPPPGAGPGACALPRCCVLGGSPAGGTLRSRVSPLCLPRPRVFLCVALTLSPGRGGSAGALAVPWPRSGCCCIPLSPRAAASRLLGILVCRRGDGVDFLTRGWMWPAGTVTVVSV